MATRGTAAAVSTLIPSRYRRHARTLVRNAVDRHAALVADAHAAERRARLAAFGATEHEHSRIEQRARDGRAGCRVDRATVNDDLDSSPALMSPRADVVTARARASARTATDRSPACGRRVDRRSDRAVPSDVVIPSPSCPAAIHRPGIASHGPISGSLSGVAGRNPVHASDDRQLAQARAGTRPRGRAFAEESRD